MDPLSYATTTRDENVVDMVNEALALNRCVLAFQPIVQARKQRHVAFYECLIRLVDPNGRHIPAGEFINDVENIQTGREIDCASLGMGLRALAVQPDLRLSINMSARSIGYRKWLDIMDKGLDADPTVGSRLILEITEGSAMSAPELVISFMRDMHERGVSFALDDFGAGATSFKHLRDFFFDILKVSGQFTRNIGRNPDNQVLAQALVSIANHFEMYTVAESVETESDARLLTSLNFDCLQGY
ncbi:MAG: EAL domain-containing protein, partial [Planktomarina sp.]